MVESTVGVKIPQNRVLLPLGGQYKACGSGADPGFENELRLQPCADCVLIELRRRNVGSSQEPSQLGCTFVLSYVYMRHGQTPGRWIF